MGGQLVLTGMPDPRTSCPRTTCPGGQFYGGHPVLPHRYRSQRRYHGEDISNTAGFKLRVIETAEQSGNRSAGHEHNISEKLVRDWRKKKAELKALPRE